MRVKHCLAAALLASSAAQAQNLGQVLKQGQFVKSTQYLTAPGKYGILQTDGNFCTYWGANPAGNAGKIGCISEKGFGAGPYFMLMQTDGNLCVYRGEDPGHRKEGYVWCSMGKPSLTPGPYALQLSGDGDLVVIGRVGQNPVTRVWAMDGRSGLTTWNDYPDKYVWITVYNEFKTSQLDSGCVKPKQSRKWTNSSLRSASHDSKFYVRAQVMQTSECKGTQYCDTTGQARGVSKAVTVREDKAKKSCYID